MSRLSQTLVLALLGAYVCRIALTDEYATYVNEWMRWPLLGAGVVLLMVAASSLVLSSGAPSGEPSPASGGHVHAAPRSAWLMAAPFFVIVLVAPQPLGAYVAERSSNRVSVAQQEAHYPPVPASDEPVAMLMSEFVARALYDPERSLEGRRIALTGFATPADDGAGWDLTRISMLCCAADSNAYRVRILKATAPPTDAWVTVTGTWVPAPTASGRKNPPAPRFDATDVAAIPAPKDPYE